MTRPAAWARGWDLEWDLLVAHTPLVEAYPLPELERLETLARRFLRAKSFEPVAPLELSPAMRELIAWLACVPIVNLGLEWYRGWRSIVVYPGDFLARHEFVDEIGVVHEVARPSSGEAWEQGPVLLSWEAIEEELGGAGGSVLFHELAHKIDLLNGAANGFPPLTGDLDPRAWTRIWQAAYQDLVAREAAGDPPGLDPYGAEDPGEFFACASEAFFLEPETIAGWRPELYEQLRRFYRQDPLAWLEIASPGEIT